MEQTIKMKLDIQKFILQEASIVIIPIIDYLANGNYTLKFFFYII